MQPPHFFLVHWKLCGSWDTLKVQRTVCLGTCRLQWKRLHSNFSSWFGFDYLLLFWYIGTISVDPTRASLEFKTNFPLEMGRGRLYIVSSHPRNIHKFRNFNISPLFYMFLKFSKIFLYSQKLKPNNYERSK